MLALPPAARSAGRAQRKRNAKPTTGAKPHQETAAHADDDDDDEACQQIIVRARSLDCNVLQRSARPPLLYAQASEQAIDDTQMFADFFEKHYPPTVDVWRHVTYLRSLLDLTPNTLMLKRARRTIGLTNLAVSTHDVRLVREARVSYGRLLGMLQFALAFPSKAQTASQVRELVATVALLTHISDSALVMGADADDSWTVHMLAAQQLYYNNVPAALPGMTSLDEGLMRHICMNGFFLAVAKRSGKNVDTTFAIGLKTKGWSDLMPHLYRLPGLLEEADSALDAGAETAVLRKIIVQLRGMGERSSGVWPEVHRPPLVSATKVHELGSAAEEHLVMADSSTFPELFVPMATGGGVRAIKVVLSTFLTLTVQCTILRIWHFRPETLAAAPDSAWEATEHSAYQLARRLCMASLSYTQDDKVVNIAVLRFILLLARNVFEQQDRLAEMGWCDACLIANRLRMQRVRAVATPTLCKIEDITPGLAEAGRYKMLFDRNAFVVRPAQKPSMRLLQ